MCVHVVCTVWERSQCAALLLLSFVYVMQVCHVMCVVLVHVCKGADLASEFLRRSSREDGSGQETGV